MSQIQQSLTYGECRCCSAKGYHKELQREYYDTGDREVYTEIFYECFRINLETTSLSPLICASCVQKLRDANSFRQLVLLAEGRLLDPLLKTSGAYVADYLPEPVEIKQEIMKEEYEDNFDNDIGSFDTFCEEDAKISPQTPSLVPVRDSVVPAHPVRDILVPINLVPGELELLQRFRTKTRRLPTAPPPLFKQYLRLFDGQTVTSRDVERILKETDERSEIHDKYKFTEKTGLLMNITNILKHSNATPFRSKTALGFPCYYCRKPLGNLEDMREHIAELHQNPTFKNLFWKYGPESIVINVDVTDLKCKICDINISNLTSLKKHLSEVHKVEMCWAYTDRVVPFKLTSTTFECQMCGCNFETFGAVERHMNVHFRNYVCNECGNGFATKTRLKVHQKTHGGSGEYPCEICSKMYKSDQKLKNHIDAVHKLLKRFKCWKCPARFTEYFARQKHLVDAHGAALIKYKCNCCDKAFYRRFDLTRHLKRDHLKEKNNECQYCDYKSYALSEMRVHMVKHVGERTHECPVCKKAYARKKTLTEHMKIHSNDRRHSCDVCGQAFIQKCSLKGHIKTHHPELNME